jgi:hypothetical protein
MRATPGKGQGQTDFVQRALTIPGGGVRCITSGQVDSRQSRVDGSSQHRFITNTKTPRHKRINAIAGESQRRKDAKPKGHRSPEPSQGDHQSVRFVPTAMDCQLVSFRVICGLPPAMIENQASSIEHPI